MDGVRTTIMSIYIRRGAPALALSLAAYGVVALAPSAVADSNGCTPAPRGISCINVKGHKLHVKTVAAVRDEFPPDPQICGTARRST